AIRAWWSQARAPGRILCAATLLARFAASVTVSVDEVSWALDNGQDFAEQQWTVSPLLTWSRANAPHRPLYTNWPPAVFFHLHRSSHELPYQSEAAVLHAFADTLRARNAVVLLFDQPTPDQIGSAVLLGSPWLRRIARVAEGVILAAT